MLKHNPKSESITNRSSFIMLLGFVKLYHGGLPGLSKSPIKPEIRRIIPKTKADLILLTYSGTRIQAISVIIPNIANAKVDCNPISIAIIMDKRAQTAARTTVITAPF